MVLMRDFTPLKRRRRWIYRFFAAHLSCTALLFARGGTLELINHLINIPLKEKLRVTEKMKKAPNIGLLANSIEVDLSC